MVGAVVWAVFLNLNWDTAMGFPSYGRPDIWI